MTDEQFNALVAMVREIISFEIANSKLDGQRIIAGVIVDPSKMLASMASARNVLVTLPAREINDSYCKHGMLPGRCTSQDCLHWYGDGVSVPITRGPICDHSTGTKVKLPFGVEWSCCRLPVEAGE